MEGGKVCFSLCHTPHADDDGHGEQVTFAFMVVPFCPFQFFFFKCFLLNMYEWKLVNSQFIIPLEEGYN